jgi:histidine ammonia-lyase
MLHKQLSLGAQINSDIIEKNFAVIRAKVAKLEEDRLLKPDIDAMIALVRSQAFTVSFDA